MGIGREEYIYNVARTIMGQLGMVPRLITPVPGLAQELYDAFSDGVRTRLLGWSDESIGRAAASGVNWPSPKEYGRTSLYEVHCGSYLPKYSGGPELVRIIAVTAIIAAMTDIIRAAHKKAIPD